MTEKAKFMRLYSTETSGLCPRWGERYTSATSHSKSSVAMANPIEGSL